MEIQDVRLVYAPAAGIGNFGGETDNWQWPRHTGDWSFYRAYVSHGRQVRAVREGERPLQAEALAQGLARGREPRRPRLRRGLPGAHATACNPYDEVKETVEWSLPRSIKRSTDRIAILEKLAKEDKETALHVAQTIRGLNNGLTKNKGVLRGHGQGRPPRRQGEDGEGPRRSGSTPTPPARRSTAT